MLFTSNRYRGMPRQRASANLHFYATRLLAITLIDLAEIAMIVGTLSTIYGNRRLFEISVTFMVELLRAVPPGRGFVFARSADSVVFF